MKKLSKLQKNQVKKWLLSSLKDCPFWSFEKMKENCLICESLFPKSKKTKMCPCHIYKFNYVIKKAKQMIENEPKPERSRIKGEAKRRRGEWK